MELHPNCYKFQSKLYHQKDEREENTILLWEVFLSYNKQSKIAGIQKYISHKWLES